LKANGWPFEKKRTNLGEDNKDKKRDSTSTDKGEQLDFWTKQLLKNNQASAHKGGGGGRNRRKEMGGE